MQQRDLSELNTGEPVLHFLIVTKLEVKTARTGKQFINLELRDQTVSLPAKIWDNVESYASKLKEGTVVKVAGLIEDFNGMPQIRIEKIRAALPEDEVSPEDFLPRSKRDPEVMKKELRTVIDSFGDKNLKTLVNQFFSGEKFEKFCKAPAGKGWHHAYLGGLLEHTLEIVRICDLMYSIHPEIKRDLLLSGALLHDFGKIEELTYESNFDYSDKGKFLGHIVMSALEIEKAASALEGFPDLLKQQLIHLVLSHQGKLEYASPVEPRTLEAIVLYQADELSAKTNAYKSAIEAEKSKGVKWTRFLPLANTALYIPDEENNDENIKSNLFDN